MKVLTIIGTRPELIRLSVIIKKLDNLVNHVLVYTNQNFEKSLSTIFFEDLKIRKPNYYFQAQSSIGTFLGNSMIEFEKILKVENPDKILTLGDTNSNLLSILSNKYNIPVYHMEAGNRCYDKNVPEEINRKIIDSVSTYNLPYTENSKTNLITEGYNKNNVYKTGNPIAEVLHYYKNQIDNSNIFEKIKINPKYILATCHRSENVSDINVLSNIVNGLNEIAKEFMIVFSVHPKTMSKLKEFNLSDNILVSAPFGFFDFVNLEKNAKIIITDSGTVQEEAALLNVPSLIIRETTERQELVESGASIICGNKHNNIMQSFHMLKNKEKFDFKLSNDYYCYNVSDIVINILISKT